VIASGVKAGPEFGQLLNVQEQEAGRAIIGQENQVLAALFQTMVTKLAAPVQAALTVAQDQLKVQQSALSVAASNLSVTQATFQALTKYAGSLSSGAFSPSSPATQYAAAKAAFDAVSAQASGGNKDAAGKLPDVANALLTQSRAMYASSSQYVSDFNRVKQVVDAVTGQYGQQMTDQQKLVDAAQRQVDLLTAQVNAAQQSLSAIQGLGDRITAAINDGTGKTGAIIAGLRDFVQQYNEDLHGVFTLLPTFDSVVAGVSQILRSSNGDQLAVLNAAILQGVDRITQNGPPNWFAGLEDAQMTAFHIQNDWGAKQVNVLQSILAALTHPVAAVPYTIVDASNPRYPGRNSGGWNDVSDSPLDAGTPIGPAGGASNTMTTQIATLNTKTDAVLAVLQDGFKQQIAATQQVGANVDESTTLFRRGAEQRYVVPA
jgi:hypothetical protein